MADSATVAQSLGSAASISAAQISKPTCSTGTVYDLASGQCVAVGGSSTPSYSRTATFTASGTFTVPADASSAIVTVIGGGGGSGGAGYGFGNDGGASSFGGALTCTGGQGSRGDYAGDVPDGGNGGTCSATGSISYSTANYGPYSGIYYGLGYQGRFDPVSGGKGGAAMATIPTQPGGSVSITVGTGGAAGGPAWGSGIPGGNGIVIIRY